ncbi:MAG TPA: VWA domain-containing protein [Bryobacteraceae bacterium]|nr:VWA domain-containing protein [Bryobacteraceae bacterium]
MELGCKFSFGCSLARRIFWISLQWLASAVLCAAQVPNAIQVMAPHFQTDVNMVVLTFTVTDGSGKYIANLKPEDLTVSEDGIPQKIASFEEGDRPAVQLAPGAAGIEGTRVFILLDVSDHMYNNYPYVCDAVTDFTRRLDPADSIAIYTFSRNLWRASPLTTDHNRARFGLINAVAGDDTAIYNALLLTLRDAAKQPGRKIVILFSNGPDNASMVRPDDVGAVAINEGIPIYIVSTQDAANDHATMKAFEFLTTQTGGKLYWARTWQKQAKAFAAIREDMAGSYTVSYYPKPNSNQGFRRIKIDVRSDAAKKLEVHVRPGYDAHALGWKYKIAH